MGKKSTALLASVIGAGLFRWFTLQFVGGDLTIGSKYTREGRDGGSALVVAFVGVGMLLYGAWGIVLSWRDGFDTVEPTSERRDDREEGD